MSLGEILRSVLEVAVVIFTVWALFHEERFADFEEKIITRFKRKKLKVIKGDFSANYRRT